MTINTNLKNYKIFAMKKLVLWSLWMIFASTNLVFAVENDFEIIPEKTNDTNVVNDVNDLKTIHTKPNVDTYTNVEWWTGTYKEDFRDRYNSIADKNSGNLWDQLASWIVNRDTILDYIVYLVSFLSQIGLFIWALMVLYSWYQYAATVFTWKAPSNDPIKNAIYGILIISFSYAIVRWLTAAFLS